MMDRPPQEYTCVFDFFDGILLRLQSRRAQAPPNMSGVPTVVCAALTAI